MKSNYLAIYLKIYISSAIFFSVHVLVRAESREDYLSRRNAILEKEERRRIGGAFGLTSLEQKVNHTLMTLKQGEFAESQKTEDGLIPPALHFFEAKPAIARSQVFKFIRAMPKGAVLHVHDAAMSDIRWLIQRGTYDPHCYMCVDSGDQLLFHFYKHPPTSSGRCSSASSSGAQCDDADESELEGGHSYQETSDETDIKDCSKGCQWQLVSEARTKSKNATQFDENIYKEMTLMVDDPDEAYPTLDCVWRRFLKIFTTLFSLVEYEPVFRDYMHHSLLSFYQDNVQYVEIRALLIKLYDVDGKIYEKEAYAELYKDVFEGFKAKYPDFNGARIIICSRRHVSASEILEDLQTAIQMKQKYPSLVAGYDLVGPENQGNSLLYFLDDLLYPSQHGIDMPYFFHAGETDWYGQDVDINILDALLLNTTRIGHGYAITKHPELMYMLREHDVAIEINPISNQVLKLVADLRNHPASELIGQNYPIVICPDDPSIWGAEGISYDYYEAFMGIGGAQADLATLKQLVMNSMKYSAGTEAEKATMMKDWEKRWSHFISSMAKIYGIV